MVPLLGVLALGGFADGHLAAAQKRVMAFSSVEEQVNQYTSFLQLNPSVAHFDDDGYGIYWAGPQRRAVPAGLEGIHGRQFTRDGIAKNELESLVDTGDKHSNIDPGVARVAPTTIAVTWREFNESDQPDDTLFLRLVDDQEVPIGEDWEFADGLAVPDFFQNAGSTFPDGLVVAWTRSVDSQVTADASVVLTRRFDATGTAATEEIEVTSIADSQPTRAQVAGLLDRSWVVVWMELFVDTPDSDGVLLRRYAADGTPLGDAEVVNSHTAGAQRYPSVASFADGRFLVAWESLGQDGSDWGIFAQRYDASAAKVGPEFQVNTYTEGVQRFSRVVTQGDSRYSIFWISDGQDGDGFGLFGQHFDWETGAVGAGFRVNTYTKGHQGWLGHSESSDSAGNLVVAWSGSGDQDGDAYGIFARRYCLADPAATRCGITAGSASDAQTPTATDAGVVLRAAVGLVRCLVCECDSDGSGAITAADALRILRNAVGVPGELSCPACCP